MILQVSVLYRQYSYVLAEQIELNPEEMHISDVRLLLLYRIKM